MSPIGNRRKLTLCIFLGTSVATGVVTAGRMLEASHGPASELGHVPLVFIGTNAGVVGAVALGQAQREQAD